MSQRAATSTNSDHIHSFSHDDESNQLTVKFHAGQVYVYYDVPLVVYKAMVALDEDNEAGKFFREAVKGNYEYEQVTARTAVEEATTKKSKKEKLVPDGLKEGAVINGKEGVYVTVKDPSDPASYEEAYWEGIETFQKDFAHLDIGKAKLCVPPNEASQAFLDEMGVEPSDLITDNYTLGRIYIGYPAVTSDRVSA